MCHKIACCVDLHSAFTIWTYTCVCVWGGGILCGCGRKPCHPLSPHSIQSSVCWARGRCDVTWLPRVRSGWARSSRARSERRRRNGCRKKAITSNQPALRSCTRVLHFFSSVLFSFVVFCFCWDDVASFALVDVHYYCCYFQHGWDFHSLSSYEQLFFFLQDLFLLLSDSLGCWDICMHGHTSQNWAF